LDKLTTAQRSRNMARVRGKNTLPEMLVRSAAHKLGLRFRLHDKRLKGSPDLVFAKHKVALFVHGCFWHQHPGCKKASLPTTKTEFWHTKLARNVERDREAIRQLRADGWRVDVIWECETKAAEAIEKRLKQILRHRSRRSQHSRIAA
jgi:DNA mismatch endonuclease, patch repair protein